jgi:hypothetical protein
MDYGDTFTNSARISAMDIISGTAFDANPVNSRSKARVSVPYGVFLPVVTKH